MHKKTRPEQSLFFSCSCGVPNKTPAIITLCASHLSVATIIPPPTLGLVALLLPTGIEEGPDNEGHHPIPCKKCHIKLRSYVSSRNTAEAPPLSMALLVVLVC